MQLPHIPDQNTSLASMISAQEVNPIAVTHIINPWKKKTESGASNSLMPYFPGHRKYYKYTGTLHNEHQQLGCDDAKPEPALRKAHIKSRKGCYTCKKRRIKVYLISISKI